MGIITGLISAATWGVLWPVAFTLLGVPMPAAAVAWVAGVMAAFAVGYRLGAPRFRTDPISRLEERQRARLRFEERSRQLDDEQRRARLARADRQAEERAEARVRELVERRTPRADAANLGPDAPARAGGSLPGGSAEPTGDDRQPSR